jgi:membrane dipeptidase
VADHVDYLRRRIGSDHIGLGSDFDGVSALPEGLEDVSTYPALLAELLARGYSADEVGKIAGGNVLRVMRQAERVAARLQAAGGPSEALFGDYPPPAPEPVDADD